MTVAERLGYAARMAAYSLRGGDWIGYAPLTGDGPAMGPVPGPSAVVRLRQAPRVFRNALAAARDAE